jgi:hypothetical protein
MYVPPFEALLRTLDTDKESLEAAKKITVPAALLKLLLQLAVAHSDFDEDRYLQANPDVRDAVQRGDLESGQMHYIGFGYFEGRKGGGTKVDERRYLREHPDVAAAIRDGKVKSASDHFHTIGAAEGRSPSADQAANAAEWKKALHGK